MRQRALAFGISTALIAGLVAFGATDAFATDDDGGVGLAVPVTAVPAPAVQTPPSVPVGTTVAEAKFEVKLVGLEPYSYVEVFANSTPVLIASGYADANGAFSALVSLPADLEPGEHSITATNTNAAGEKTTITVLQLAVTADGKIGAAGSSALSSSSSYSSYGDSASAVADSEVTSESLTAEAAVEALGADPFSLGGVLYFGGFSAGSSYADGPFLPSMMSRFVVKNVSEEPVNATATLAVFTPVGTSLRAPKEVHISNIEPGETRLVVISTPSVGQWGVYSANLKLSVPQGEFSLKRQTTAIVMPLVSILIALMLMLMASLYIAGVHFLGWPNPFRKRAKKNANVSADWASDETGAPAA